MTDRVQGYTDLNPVAWVKECRQCGMSISSDNPTPELVQLWDEAHEGHDKGDPK